MSAGPKPRAILERMSPIVSQFTFARHGACYPLSTGDFRGPVVGAAGTRHFEPDGVVFCDLACLLRPYQPPAVCRRSLSVALTDRSVPAFHELSKPCSGRV
jgi:hypothetical protein